MATSAKIVFLGFLVLLSSILISANRLLLESQDDNQVGEIGIIDAGDCFSCSPLCFKAYVHAYHIQNDQGGGWIGSGSWLGSGPCSTCSPQCFEAYDLAYHMPNDQAYHHLRKKEATVAMGMDMEESGAGDHIND
ncbi:hypothetical protein M5689_017002 [Euphorbia peplus]|nr:hypothetical protein M5689_017002 [Euphorbia peplus]